MANNRMYLTCRVCQNSKPFMLAKYYPSTGWYAWPIEPVSIENRINTFFEEHRHDSQWGAGFDISFEIEPDYHLA